MDQSVTTCVTGAVDAIVSSSSLVGWAASPLGSTIGFDLSVRLHGETQACNIEWSYRRDLAHWPGNTAGFRIDLRQPISPSWWVVGAAEVWFRTATGTQAQLALTPQARFTAAGASLTETISALGAAPQTTALKSLLCTLADRLSGRPYEQTVLRQAAGLLAQDGRHDCAEAVEVLLPFGLRSLDGSATLGRLGHAFLVGGSNAVLDQYVRSVSPQVEREVHEWLELIGQRAQRCADRGCRFVQTIIPEKLSVMPELLFPDLITPTARLRALETAIGIRPLAADYVSVVQRIGSLARRDALFHKIDTHFTEPGCHAVFGWLLEALDLGIRPEVAFSPDPKPAMGDLAARFVGPPLLIMKSLVSDSAGFSNPRNLCLVESVDPGGDVHTGTRRHWVNADAVSGQRVLIFGNSFFERGEEARYLSWWFARYFQDVLFIWHSEMIESEIEAFRPDIVICQTIERFLHRVPSQ